MDKAEYDCAVVRGVVSILVGILISFQLVRPDLNLAPWLTYGRLRPLHTNAGIFGWAIGSFFALFYYMVKLRQEQMYISLGVAVLFIVNGVAVTAATA